MGGYGVSGRKEGELYVGVGGLEGEVFKALLRRVLTFPFYVAGRGPSGRRAAIVTRRPSPAHADDGTTTDNAVKRPTPPERRTPSADAVARQRHRRRQRRRR